MAKTEPAAPETNLAEAGMPQSYGMGIQQGFYGNGRNNPGNPYPDFSRATPNRNINNGIMNGYNQALGRMGGSGPSNDFLSQLLQLTMRMGGANNYRRMDNGMGGPRGTGFNFSTPISGPSLFSGLPGVTTGSQVGQRLTDPNAQPRQGGFHLTGK